MKKLICLLLVLLLALGMVACNSAGGENGGTAGTEDGGKAEENDKPATGELFIWSELDEGAIVGLTEEGLQATNIEFPANCVKLVSVESEKLEKVSFANPDTVFTTDTFNGCSALKQAELPANLQEIPTRAFYDCGALEEIVIPAGVTKIGSNCFWSCKSLAGITLPEGLVSVGRSAFKSCTGLTAVKIPASVQEIGEDAFRDCSALKTVEFAGGVALIDEGAFEKCTALEKVELKEGTKTLGSKAFAFCDSLKEIHLPASIEQAENDSILQTHTFDVYVKAGSYMEQRLSTMSENAYYNKITE